MDDSSAKPTGERPAPPADEIEEAARDDFAARALISNAFIGGATPVAGLAVNAKEKLLEEMTDEERAMASAREGKAGPVEP